MTSKQIDTDSKMENLSQWILIIALASESLFKVSSRCVNNLIPIPMGVLLNMQSQSVAKKSIICGSFH